MYEYGLVGNCHISAFIDRFGSIDWLCMPRPDSPPIFGRLLDEKGGNFAVISASQQAEAKSNQYYLPNTNILETHITLADGSEFRITDFCPRFEQHGRMFRPPMLFRRIELVSGQPKLQIKLAPVEGWNKQAANAQRGNSHLTFHIRGYDLRVLTNASLTKIVEEGEFLLHDTLYFGISWDTSIQDDLTRVTLDFLDRTRRYWETWIKHCNIPSLFQSQVIRSALALKLHCYEDTGAILAALSTSLPEEIGGQRNWDYRFCWLRDAAFTLSSFHQLGHFEEMENFIKFLLEIAHDRESLHPVYTLDARLPLPETSEPAWSGFQNSAPVRWNNLAAEQIQHDVYGEMVLALTPVFMDDRFLHLRTREHLALMETLGRLCERSIAQPDAGVWEYRGRSREHTFSNLLCWAGLERIRRIRNREVNIPLKFDLNTALQKADVALRRSLKEGSLRVSPDIEDMDAALLLLPILGFPDHDINSKTVQRIWDQLKWSDDAKLKGFLFRYRAEDDFGSPGSAFVICSFWLASALHKLKRTDEARKVFEQALRAQNHLGLIAEHFQPDLGLQLGNFPQAYSHVGLINSAFDISPAWSEIL